MNSILISCFLYLIFKEYDNVLGKKITIDVDYSALQGQYGQAPFIEELFKPLIKAENTTKRFYIEAGAFDGVKGSNTLRLELNPLWSGKKYILRCALDDVLVFGF